MVKSNPLWFNLISSSRSFSVPLSVHSAGRSLQIEDIVTLIQDEEEGVPIRTVKSFMTKIPSVVTGKNYKRCVFDANLIQNSCLLYI